MPSRIRHSDSSSDSGYSDSSNLSKSTAPTACSHQASPRSNKTGPPIYSDRPWEWTTSGNGRDARSSASTYASTIPSTDDLDEDLPEYEEADLPPEDFLPAHALSSTPLDFADFFPSTRRLCIRHDDSTLDGNMNLRVDTDVRTFDGRNMDLTLFHLRMHDLKNREFSFRRYCRDSGREVCHSSRKYAKPATKRRPILQRSMSNALSSFRFKSENNTTTIQSLKRQDSGYDSMSEDEEETASTTSSRDYSRIPMPTNTTQLEFSNYAHIDVKRRGTKASKRYEFDYWGTNYAWKRVSRKDSHRKETSYHLINTETNTAVALIVPVTLTTAEARTEDSKGGWVPPCSMWITDERLIKGLTDVAE